MTLGTDKKLENLATNINVLATQVALLHKDMSAHLDNHRVWGSFNRKVTLGSLGTALTMAVSGLLWVLFQVAKAGML